MAAKSLLAACYKKMLVVRLTIRMFMMVMMLFFRVAASGCLVLRVGLMVQLRLLLAASAWCHGLGNGSTPFSVQEVAKTHPCMQLARSPTETHQRNKVE